MTGEFRAYYYSFNATGDARIDAILEAVASAGKGCHNTEDWGSYPSPEENYVDLIQRAADQATQQLKNLEIL